MSIEVYLDELQRFADAEFRTELLAARAEYFAELGQVHEDDDLFEAHLDRFLDWFLFDRVLPATGQNVLVAFLEQRRAVLPADQLAIYEDFLGHVHGLFQVRKAEKTGVQLRHLFTKSKFFVRDEVPGAFTKHQIFEARLLPLDREWYFSKGYIFHPLTAVRAIEKRLKQLPADDPDAQRTFMRNLAIRRLRADRYKHVEAEQFYRF
jgi:hypothetical protein